MKKSKSQIMLESRIVQSNIEFLATLNDEQRKYVLLQMLRDKDFCPIKLKELEKEKNDG